MAQEEKRGKRNACQLCTLRVGFTELTEEEVQPGLLPPIFYRSDSGDQRVFHRLLSSLCALRFELQMLIRFFMEGLLIGFVVAVPVGPIGLFCLSRVLSGRLAYGLLSGLGVATADALSGGIAALGLTLVSDFIFRHQLWLRPMGGAFLCYLGYRIFSLRSGGHFGGSKEVRLVGAYGSTFLLTFTNPVTVLSFVAIYAGLGIESLRGDYWGAGALTSGIFIGSSLWWVILGGGVLLFHEKFTHDGLRWVHKLSGLIIAGFGVFAILGF